MIPQEDTLPDPVFKVFPTEDPTLGALVEEFCNSHGGFPEQTALITAECEI